MGGSPRKRGAAFVEAGGAAGSGLSRTAPLVGPSRRDKSATAGAARADCYGYEIVKSIAVRSRGEYELKEATMYSSVRRLEADGDITWYWGDESQGGRRKYFRITEKGRATYARNKSNWEYAKRVLDTLL